MLPRPTIEAFDAWFSERLLRFDALAMAPTAADLEDAEPWLAEQDANPLWPDHVRATLDDLGERLGHGV